MGVAKGPTALLQKTRRGLARGLESGSEGQPEKREQGGQEAIVFHPVKMRNNQRRRVQHEHLTEDHQELITFVTEGWVRVKREMEQGDGAVAVYQDTTNPTLDHFQPFDHPTGRRNRKLRREERVLRGKSIEEEKEEEE